MTRPRVVIDLEGDAGRDLAHGGAFVHGLDLPELAQCDLVLQCRDRELTLQARVVMVGTGGCALEIVGFNQAIRQRIAEVAMAATTKPAPPRDRRASVPPANAPPPPPPSTQPPRAKQLSGPVPTRPTPAALPVPVPPTTAQVAVDELLELAPAPAPPPVASWRRSEKLHALALDLSPIVEPAARASTPRLGHAFDLQVGLPSLKLETEDEANARHRDKTAVTPKRAEAGTLELDTSPVEAPPLEIADESDVGESAAASPPETDVETRAAERQAGMFEAVAVDAIEAAPADAGEPGEADQPDAPEIAMEADEPPPADDPTGITTAAPDDESGDYAEMAVSTYQTDMPTQPGVALPEQEEPLAGDAPGEPGEEPEEEQDEERKRIARNIHERVRGLNLQQQIKTALTGEIGERLVLERLYGKTVWEPLLRNPRITGPEVARIARMGQLPRPLVEIIVSNGGWLQIPEVRRALLTNPRLGPDQIIRVLRLLPKHELKLATMQAAYPMAVREVARRLMKSEDKSKGRI